MSVKKIKSSGDVNNTDHLDDKSYKLAEDVLIQQALKRTYMERFLFATKLYKIQKTLSKSTVKHQPNFSK